MADEPVLDEELRRVLDRTGPPAVGEVTAKEIKRFAYAIDDLNPLYLDEEYARSVGLPGVVAPPLFVVVPTHDDTPLNETQPDGIGKSPAREIIQKHYSRVVAGGTEYEFFQHVRPGDVLTAERRSGEVYQKQGRSGPLLFSESITIWTNQRGEKVATQKFTSIFRR